MSDAATSALLAPTLTFAQRHLGPSGADPASMLESVGAASPGEVIDQTAPEPVRGEAPGAPRGIPRQDRSTPHGRLSPGSPALA